MMKKTLTALAMLCLLAGCSTLDRINSLDKQARADENTTTKHLQSLKSGNVVRELPSQWINPVPLNASGHDKERLPACLIPINRRGVMSLNDINAFITLTCNISVVLTPDARQITQVSGATEQIKGNLPEPDASGMLPLAQMGGSSSAQSLPRQTTELSLRGVYWKASLDGFLDNITARLGLSWRYEEGRIVIFYLDTRNFPVLFMDSLASFTSKTVSGTTSSTGSSGGGSSGGISGDSNTSQSTDMAIKSNLYGDVAATVKSMLTPGVGRMNLSAGVLTVTDTSRVLTQIGRYIDDRNRELNRQVVLNVQIYSVESKRSDQFGIDWDAVLSLGSVKSTFTNAFANASDMGIGGAMVVDGKGAGTKALVKALSEQGKVSVQTQASSLTTNLSAVPIQVALQQDYLPEISSEQAANVGSSVSVTRSTITTGFNMTVLPYLMPNSSHMQLQFSVNMSDDPTMRTQKEGENSTVELMKTRLKTFTQRVNMKSGQTLILSGYEQLNTTADHQGVITPRFFGLGGGATGGQNRTQLVMFVTPIIQG
ncbi:PilN family type IVB pilus formation outer membrane protein [Salmonella enterica]|nr:PilN family type IVB pilus formation outer membrane protein [Salmonella enterica]EAV1936828.1 PilN family type IVB pilus formation outer membrane protein [Salmonella enterica]EBB7504393.1 PilN family type IVB pilus formation outer membrane protein [Salmonella enterica]EKH8225425.1 PilN family type IVB pilus formation outer membrane protein [Salmonella enterica]